MRASQIPSGPFLLMIAALSGAALWFGPAAAHETPTTTPAARFLQMTTERALGLVRPPITPKAEAELDDLIRESMDWPGLTRFALGRYAAELDAEGMKAAAATLEQQLGALARRAGSELPGLTLAVHDMWVDREGNRHVLTAAILPQFNPVEVEWTLVPAAARNGYRIADIKAFGLTLRQFLRGWVAGLVAAHGGDAASAFESRDRGAAPGNPPGGASPP